MPATVVSTPASAIHSQGRRGAGRFREVVMRGGLLGRRTPGR
jgi:hypothetical protein